MSRRLLEEYCPDDKMSDLIGDNSSLLMVMSRFGISLGFGDKSVKDICTGQGVDTGTFIAVANFISGKKSCGCPNGKVSLPSLIAYLKRAHSYFLEFSLPAIRRKLIDAIDCSGSDDVAFLILKFYDEYVMEVRKHMEYENDTVFAYVEELLHGCCRQGYRISMFADKHNHIDSKLKELKDIIIRYYSGKDNDLLNAVLFDIINCEQDLNSHCMVEDRLFVPAVEQIEKTVKKREKQVADTAGVEDVVAGKKLETLSEREKEIIGCVAKGMTNKEIADSLCISVHTVTTHRRNIATKLQIHTAAGLTIYAIVHKLVRLQDIRLN